MENCCETTNKVTTASDFRWQIYERAQYILVDRYNALFASEAAILYPTHEQVVELSNKIEKYLLEGK